MKIDKLLFEKSLDIAGIDSSKSVVKVTDKTLVFFKDIGLKNELIVFFMQFSYAEYIDFDGISFSRVNNIRANNLEA